MRAPPQVRPHSSFVTLFHFYPNLSFLEELLTLILIFQSFPVMIAGKRREEIAKHVTPLCLINQILVQGNHRYQQLLGEIGQLSDYKKFVPNGF